MPLQYIFWVIMIIIALFTAWRGYNNPPNRELYGMSFLTYVLIGMLGWRVFGSAVQ